MTAKAYQRYGTVQADSFIDANGDPVGGGVDGLTIDEAMANIAMGFSTTPGEGDGNILVGDSAEIQNDANETTLIGKAVAGYGNRATAVGESSSAGEDGVALGSGAGTNFDGVALGKGASANTNSIAIGKNVSAAANRTVIGGIGTVASFGGSLAIEVVGVAPSGDPGLAGVIRYCTADTKLYIWSGSGWVTAQFAL